MSEEVHPRTHGRSITGYAHWIAAPTLRAGLVAGAASVGVACLMNCMDPIVVLQTAAAVFLGDGAFQAGPAAEILGLMLLWAASNVVAGIFVAAIRSTPLLRQRRFTAGLLYGVAIFVLIYYVLLPLSALGRHDGRGLAEHLAIALIFGLTVALYAESAPRPNTVRDSR